MENQVVLKTTINDIHDFYVGVLGGKITRHFKLGIDASMKDLDIPQSQEVYELKLQDQVLELCPYPEFEQDSMTFTHLNFGNATKAYQKALKNNYWASHRDMSGKERYFIKDKHNNLFELEN